MKITFFPRPAGLRKWLEKNHATAKELLVGFYKKDSGKPSITWQESVDEALCVGWIDGVRKRVDEVSYTIRFSPRRPTSVWSAINIRRVAALSDEGRMKAPGLKAFERRRENRSGIYAYEQRRAQLEEPYASLLRKNESAWLFFEAQPPGYRKLMSWWILSAKKEETRHKRLETLIAESARGRRV
ncbi:MAG: YdeI/OmpD-associated family protein [Thermoanaerobaculia bacterium]|nr:YdeI/OmpD-associated family protein [Thermoanaerobaculia bacterium]